MSRFTFHETEMLASDLSRLLQVPDTDALIDSLAAKNATRASESFPGTILLYDNRPCAAIGYNWEPGGTVAVSEPVVLLEASNEVYQALCNQLLKHTKCRVAAAGAQRLHYLQGETADHARFAELLTENRFVLVTDILQWELSLARGYQCSPQHECEFQRYDFSGSDADALQELLDALNSVLECSEDLRNQPRPSAAGLLARWEQMQATVTVCRCTRKIAGVISCAAQRTRSAAAVSTSLPTTTNICIEYIGVVPEFRRRQIASLMIQQIPSLTNPDDDAQANRLTPRELKVSAYSDAANAPATSLYERCGFTQKACMHLWCSSLNQEVNEAT